jgi:hypothetical protein
MRINEVVNPYDRGALSGLRNLGRSALNQFTQSQLGVSAYGDAEEEEFKKQAQVKQQKQQAAQAAAAADQAAREIDQANVPAGSTAPQISAANTQSVAPATTAPAQTTPTPNFAQGIAGQTTINAPTATVPAIRPYVPQVSTATTTAPVQTPTVNPAKPPQVYTFDGRALNPANANDANIIKQLQAAGVTSGRTNPKPSSAQTARALQDLRQTAIRTGDRDYLRQINQRLGLPPDSTT